MSLPMLLCCFPPFLHPSVPLFPFSRAVTLDYLAEKLINNILRRTFSKSPCKKKPINPKSVLPKQKEAGVREISFSGKLHLQPFSLKFHSKLITFDRPWGTMSHAKSLHPRQWRQRAGGRSTTSCVPASPAPCCGASAQVTGDAPSSRYGATSSEVLGCPWEQGAAPC